jgi:hypothetical protein
MLSLYNVLHDSSLSYRIGRYAFDLAFENTVKVTVVSHPSLLQVPADIQVRDIYLCILIILNWPNRNMLRPLRLLSLSTAVKPMRCSPLKAKLRLMSLWGMASFHPDIRENSSRGAAMASQSEVI